MNGKDKLKINVKIAGREFTLYVVPDAESEIRTAAKLITETFEKYRDKFPNEDYANILAKASLHVLVGQNKKVRTLDNSELMDGLFKLEEDLENFINETI